MNRLPNIFVRILSIAIGLLLLPVFAFLGLVLIGITAVAGIVGSVALSRRMNAMREEMMAQQKERFKNAGGRDKFRDGPIIDADPA